MSRLLPFAAPFLGGAAAWVFMRAYLLPLATSLLKPVRDRHEEILVRALVSLKRWESWLPSWWFVPLWPWWYAW
jgi:hypothetical protein